MNKLKQNLINFGPGVQLLLYLQEPLQQHLDLSSVLLYFLIGNSGLAIISWLWNEKP